jgi:hypothetical protein
VDVALLNSTGNFQPVPKNEFDAAISKNIFITHFCDVGFFCFEKYYAVMIQPPIITVTQPTAGIAPQMQTSVVRTAGFPPIITVALPIGKGLDVI